MTKDIKYRYARTIDGRIVSIENIDIETKDSTTYYCLGCNRELKPKALTSKCRKPHFWHQPDNSCSSESYLHSFAKHILKNRFEDSSQFIVEVLQYCQCDKYDDCIFRQGKDCRKQTIVSYDLKKYYPTCKEEGQTIDGKFRADLLLVHKDNPQKSVLLEVLVHHPCTEFKKSSNRPIIEFTIGSEEDALYLQKCPIKVTQKSKNNHFAISFFGFSDKANRRLSFSKIDNITRACILKDGNVTTQIVDCHSFDCNPAENEVSVFYANGSYDTDSFYEFLSSDKWLSTKKCIWCGNLDKPFCNKYEFQDTIWDRSVFCPYYTESSKFHFELVALKKGFTKEDIVEILSNVKKEETIIMDADPGILQCSDEIHYLIKQQVDRCYKNLSKDNYWINWRAYNYHYGLGPTEETKKMACLYFGIHKHYRLFEIAIAMEKRDKYHIFFREDSSSTFSEVATDIDVQESYLGWAIERELYKSKS